MAKRIGNTWSALTTEQNEQWNKLFDKYVPAFGKAPTVGGEILRAMSRLIYRFYNDGDMAGEGYGNLTCNSSYRYLGCVVPNFPGMFGFGENEYEERLLDGEIMIFNYLQNNPVLFETVNDIDSVKSSEEDLKMVQEEYE